jgi:tRNA pseudouridine38-40 synthase
LSSSDQLGATQRWRLDLAYDGQAFNGFAFQPHRDTVVGLLRSTLARTLRLDHEPVIVGAGRTDAGVHAYHQVVHIDLPRAAKVRSLDADRLRDSLNKQLRGRVQILSIEAVADEFHARFSATWREYRYLVLEQNAPGLDSTNSWAWSIAVPLDLAAMNRVASRLVGTHDFRAFCRRPANVPTGEPLLRRVIAAKWERLDDLWSMSPREVPALRLTIRAQSFCHNMVRCLASAMVAVGAGTLDEGEIDRRLVSGDRHQLPQPAPAGGLALVGVGYDTLL